MSKELIKRSKFLSLVLRHEPEKIGIVLDENGWVEVDVLLTALTAYGRGMERASLERVVVENDKKRFAFSEDGQRIRANQGHSVEVDLALVPQAPPEKLFHGTVDKFLAAIFTQGLVKGERHHVHLSPDLETATKVGLRRGNPVILEIDAAEMHRGGHKFFLSANGVWLTDTVPPQFLQRLP